MERTSWRHRIVQFCRWKPESYKQVWLLAPFGWGAPGFIIWFVVGHHRLYEALTYAVSITFFGGLASTWQLGRRRQQGR